MRRMDRGERCWHVLMYVFVTRGHGKNRNIKTIAIDMDI
jgi:hypothetical protein